MTTTKFDTKKAREQIGQVFCTHVRCQSGVCHYKRQTLAACDEIDQLRDEMEKVRAELVESKRYLMADEERRKLTGDAIQAEGELASLRDQLAERDECIGKLREAATSAEEYMTGAGSYPATSWGTLDHAADAELRAAVALLRPAIAAADELTKPTWTQEQIDAAKKRANELDRILPPLADELTKKGEPSYPCADCGCLRTRDQGGQIFTVCDVCWDKHYKPAPSQAAPEKGEVGR